ncbi:hypothetical protein [Aurantibacter sp.]|uniref:hypothetical protein n=1 Tax=Aurantibacter sp. TaxID=2807103 RepID=UPI0032644DB5
MVSNKQNIVFLCGSLEPGRDGVGDYTRRLAGEIIRQGHRATIISLNDGFCNFSKLDIQKDDKIDIQVYRLSSLLSQAERFLLADEWISKLNPHWLSLQFVPFSFHPKGLPFSLSKQLKKLGHGRKCHVMFHELWLGINRECITKNKIIGYFQKFIFKEIHRNLKPDCIHTHTKYYQFLLTNLVEEPNLLPLFSNIPVTKPVKQSTPNNQLKFVVFGGIAPASKFEAFTKELSEYAKKMGKEVVLTIVGRSGSNQKKWVNIWESYNLKYQVLGEQNPAQISKILTNADIALSTTPIALLEKSGTASAMLLHKTPIISVSHNWTPNAAFKHEPLSGTVQFVEGQLENSLLNLQMTQTDIQTLNQVASKLLDDLKCN